jgi:hypothetical protein
VKYTVLSDMPPGFFVLPDTPRIWHQPPYLSGEVIPRALL